jgi:hypothetical protein
MISSALYRFFGMVQISSDGFLPLSIWTSYFGLGQSRDRTLDEIWPGSYSVLRGVSGEQGLQRRCEFR